MEANGSFIIKNLGKSSIFVNGKEIMTGRICGLSTGCLIEVTVIPLHFLLGSYE